MTDQYKLDHVIYSFVSEILAYLLRYMLSINMWIKHIQRWVNGGGKDWY